MPDGNQFPSLFSAFQHMVKNDYLLSQINVSRGFLKHEGWEFDNLLPSGWQVKSKGPDSHWYIGRHGEFFENTEKAIDFIGSNSEYTIEDLDNLKEKMEGEKTAKEVEATSSTPKAVKMKLKLNWFVHETLPNGWKIRRVLNKSGTEVDHFLSPTGDTIAGRKGCWEYMTENNFPMEDIEKIWKFSWKTASATSPKRKASDNTIPSSKKNRVNEGEGSNKRKSMSEVGNSQKKLASDGTSETLNYLKSISSIHNLSSSGVLDIVNRKM